jgi:hypothetical protein
MALMLTGRPGPLVISPMFLETMMLPQMRLRWPRVAGLVASVAALSAASSGLGAQRPRSDDTLRVALPGLHHEAIAFDPVRSRVVLYEGLDSLRSTWEWDHRAWRRTADSATGPLPARFGATMGYDPERRRMLLFGGWERPAVRGGASSRLCDTWAYDGRRWERVDDGPCVTDRVRNNGIVYDTRRRELLLLDGTPELGVPVRPMRLWRWGDRGWVPLDSLGPRRTGWDRGVYDESRGVLVVPVFDGPDAGVWEWHGSQWHHAKPDSGPRARQVYGLAYEQRSRRVVLVGGQSYSRPSTFLPDMWSWDGASWTEMPLGEGLTPSARSGGTLLRDGAGDRLLYFGGYQGPPMRYIPELWSFDSQGWKRLLP